MKELVEHVLENDNINLESVLADDGVYDNKSFKYLQKKRIKSAIKVQKNSIISPKNNKVRNREVSYQMKDFRKWKKNRKYGKL